MQRYVGLNTENRIVSTTDLAFPQDQPVFEFPNDFDFEKQADYKLIGGELAHDPLPIPVVSVMPTFEEVVAENVRLKTDVALLENCMADVIAILYSMPV